MRSEENPLDLNNLPEDYTRDNGKQASEDSSSSAVVAGSYRRKKNGSDEEGGKLEDESGKVYECRFCSLKFCKSQALGGHMNRHRQERETETLNKARQLVFTNDLAPGHIGYVQGGQTMSHGGYHHHQPPPNMADFRSMYPTTRLFPTSSPLIPPPQQPPPPPPSQAAPPYMYTSPSRLLSFPPQPNDYFLGHVLSNSNYGPNPTEQGNNYTCIGAPVGHSFPNGGGNAAAGGGGGGRDMSLHNQEEGLNWGRR